MSLPTEKLLDLDYWKSLNPHLSVSDSPIFSQPIDLPQSQLEEVSDTIHHDGYLHQGPIFKPDDITALRTGIETS